MATAPMIELPPLASVPDEARSRATLPIRYEDITQDGKLRLDVLPAGLAEAIWRGSIPRLKAASELTALGVIPILTRHLYVRADSPFSVASPMTAEGAYELAHTKDETGEVSRILLNMWTTVKGPRGITHGPPPASAGEEIVAGRMFAEHVFTRLFAAPGERRVLSLDVQGMPRVPAREWPLRRPEDVLSDTGGATPLDSFEDEPPRVAFGLTHTDANHHVNSLVYPRLFEEASLRRLVRLGRSGLWLSCETEVLWRKPCFPGQEVSIALRAYALGHRVMTVGAFVEPGATPPYSRAYACLRMVFESA